MRVLSTDLLAFYRDICSRPLTVVDLETSGHKPPRSRAIEVSVLNASLKDGILNQETYLINPGVSLPYMITQITGITQEMVEDGLPPEEVWLRCLPLLEQGVLTAHNVGFDYPFIRSEYARLGISFYRSKSEQFCTVKLARLMLSELPSRSLPNLVKHFQFPVGESHRAEADTMACWLLAEMLLKEIANEDDEAVLARIGQQLLSVSDAAKIIGGSQKAARDRLDAAGVEPCISQRTGTPFYRRVDVERVYWQKHQLSLS
ncbi:MAG: 3'-5' exonuclease [Plectolyngbya sp. WJT66-NPBG17]|jgi:DNA polymerase-3 subunit epsilon|nr:3'-5' exonuclease [Plectolyngbya sp. WJT66-NPBG17]MBW4526902.1 3'-5' exonuclease [Phormidium tanganyikae FI6-MK23]